MTPPFIEDQMDNKLLVTNLAILAIIRGAKELILIDPLNPHLGFKDCQTPFDFPTEENVLKHVINREKLQFESNRATFGGSVYTPPEFTAPHGYNNWLVAISIQDALIPLCGKEEYQSLKRDLYRVWFNKESRKLSKDGLVVTPTNLVIDRDTISWDLHELKCVWHYTEFLPNKHGRKLYVTDQNHIKIVDGESIWVLDIALRGDGWESLVARSMNNQLTLTPELIINNLTKTPMVSSRGHLVTITVPGVVVG